MGEAWRLPEAERHQRYPVRFEVLIYYYDPKWKAIWGRSGESDDFISLGNHRFEIKSGQRVLIEGFVTPADGMVVEEPRVTVIDPSVPLQPVSARGRIGETELLNKRFVEVEGYVDKVEVIDRWHIRAHLAVEGWPVEAQILADPGSQEPDLTDAFVRLRGVYSATPGAAGSRPTLALWVPSLSGAEVTGRLQNDQRFVSPVVNVEQLGLVPEGARVKVAGAVHAQEPGKWLVLQDGTGEVTLHTIQSRRLHPGEMVEAIGEVQNSGTEHHLRDALVRRSITGRSPHGSEPHKLRLADQLRELEPEEAAKGYPVQLSGVVTWARPKTAFFYLHDSSGGVCVNGDLALIAHLRIGMKVEVTGVSAAGRFIPVMMASAVKTSGPTDLPESRPITLEQAMTGVEEAQWVSMSGLVRSVAPEGPGMLVDLTTSAGEFSARLPPNERWASLAGSVIRVSGICVAVTNDRRQLKGIQVWVPSHRFVEVEDPAPANPFATAARSIASLRQFPALQSLNRRVRVSGVVTYVRPGRLLRIQEGTEALLVLSRTATPVAVGERLEAVGFPGRLNGRLVLRESVCRRASPGEPVAAARPARLHPIDPELDGRLVRIRGELLDTTSRDGETRLLVQQDQAVFEAFLDAPVRDAAPKWVARSQLELTGVYELVLDEERQPQSVRLLLRSAADVEVIARAPWWNVRRVLGLTTILALAMVLGLIWVIALRRRVRRQTQVIRAQMESEKAARLDAALARASKLESLAVLAGGIAHDFNNLLTVVMGNLSLARMDQRLHPETVQCLAECERASARARDLTHQLLTFAKGGEPVRASASLPEIVREAAQFGLHGSKVSCEYDFASDLWPALVDKGQAGQVVHNLIINASQAMPAGGMVRLALRNEVVAEARSGLTPGRYVKLSVTDAGQGIPAENLSRIFDPYFTTKLKGNGLGLATVQAIVKKHQGHVEVRSMPGQGTTFDVWLPAADTPPVEKPAVAPAAAPGPARVLLMDDEASIRSLVLAVVRRMGCEATAVEDGSAAVAEYRAAQKAGCKYDLVILDLTVPGRMGGAEAMQKLREIDPLVRAIVSSGYSKDPVMARYREYGFCARVPKPYQAGELIDAIRAALRDRPAS